MVWWLYANDSLSYKWNGQKLKQMCVFESVWYYGDFFFAFVGYINHFKIILNCPISVAQMITTRDIIGVNPKFHISPHLNVWV
jgi:hypothetical protein